MYLKIKHLHTKVYFQVTVNIVPDNHMLIEGTDAKLICEADANPADVTYRWYMNQKPVFPENPVEFVLTNVSRKHHDTIVKCEARNLVGKSEDSQTLDVTCKYSRGTVH